MAPIKTLAAESVWVSAPGHDRVRPTGRIGASNARRHALMLEIRLRLCTQRSTCWIDELYSIDYIWIMYSVRPLPEFTAWLDKLADASIRGVLVARIKRLERGLLGDVESVGDGVSELRIHIGAGWRVYFTQRDGHLVVLLAGGSKRTQKSDIRRAKALAALLD